MVVRLTSLLTGGAVEDGVDNGLYMMQLLLMTQMDGCKAKAKFFMVDRKAPGDNCEPNCGGDLPGSLWYETEILITRNAVNLRPTELVAELRISLLQERLDWQRDSPRPLSMPELNRSTTPQIGSGPTTINQGQFRTQQDVIGDSLLQLGGRGE